MAKDPKKPVREKIERIIIPMPEALIASIDDVRFADRMPSRSEAVRQLLVEALQARAKK